MKPIPSSVLRLHVAKDHESLSQSAGEFIVNELTLRPDLLLCASAGGTPTGTYEKLGARFARAPRLFKHLRVVQIDEWGGLPCDHPATCRNDLKLKLLVPLKMSGSRFQGFKSDASDPDAECHRIANWLSRHGPIDICLLGLGLNGHIAMNEPARSFRPLAHAVKLAPGSRKHSMLQSLRKKPRYGMTLGLGEILRARKILLLVSGAPKRAVLKQLLQPRVSPRFPASFLWLHPDVTLICDRASMGRS